MARQNKSTLYVGASVLLIMIAILATAIVSQTGPNNSSATDIRAKAGIASSLKATATAASTDLSAGTLTVNNLRFIESTGQISDTNLGTWTVTPPLGFDLASVSPGVQLTLSIVSQTFLTNSHTFTASQITVGR